MLAHDAADVDGGFSGVVEGNRGNEMVADVGANDVVEEMSVNEAEIAVDGGSGTTGEGPCLVVVVRHAGVGVLEEGDGNCEGVVS